MTKDLLKQILKDTLYVTHYCFLDGCRKRVHHVLKKDVFVCWEHGKDYFYSLPHNDNEKIIDPIIEPRDPIDEDLVATPDRYKIRWINSTNANVYKIDYDKELMDVNCECDDLFQCKCRKLTWKKIKRFS